MADDAGISRKERKALRDAERRRKGSKPQISTTEPASAEDDSHHIAAAQADVALPSSSHKKRKADVKDNDVESAKSASQSLEAEPQSKKRKRESDPSAAGDDDASPATAGKKPRFIVFIGNLPFSATDASLKAHFKKLEPFNLRHRTDLKTKKSKGFAFLEFENYDRMKTCLKLYHHTMFDSSDLTGSDSKGTETFDDHKSRSKSKNRNVRRINVELTAGGGGKAEGRKEKIKVKNTRLEEQRKRRAEEERKAGMRKERKEKALRGEQAEATDQTASPEQSSEGIHPSRLAQMNS